MWKFVLVLSFLLSSPIVQFSSGLQTISLVHAATFDGPKGQEALVSVLKEIYKTYPSSRLTGNPSRLKKAAQTLFPFQETVALDLAHLIEESASQFLVGRETALSQLVLEDQLQPSRYAVVSGLSIGGMVATAILAKAGYHVKAFEIREDHTRNIQWAGRQGLIDQLSSIDSKLASDFLSSVASDIPHGSIKISLTGRNSHPQPLPLPGNLTQIPTSGEKLMPTDSAVIMECKKFEAFLMRYLKTLPEVEIHLKGSIQLRGPNLDGKYKVVEQRSNGAVEVNFGVPDLVVISEGSGSSTRKQLGIRSVRTSPTRNQIAGFVELDMGGVMTKASRVENENSGNPEILLTGTLARKGTQRTWIVSDISTQQNFEPFESLYADKTDESYLVKRQVLIDAEFRRIAAHAMEMPLGEVEKLKIGGPMDVMGADGTQDRLKNSPRFFTLQQNMSTTAVAGTNVVGLGDFVGNAHWSVGGGMQIAAIAHGERLKELLFDFELGANRFEALRKYDQGVFEDTLAWGKRGIVDFYPSLNSENKEKVREIYADVIRNWRQEIRSNLALDPLQELNSRISSLQNAGR